MSGTGIGFATDVTAWVEQAGALADAALQATATDALARVKQLTPVKTGYLRSSWIVIPPDDALPILGQEESSAAVIASLHIGDIIVIANPVVYAARIEFGFVGTDSLGRHYDQKGVGMMQQTIAELPIIAEAATERVVSGLGE